MRCKSRVITTGCKQPLQPFRQADVAVRDGGGGENREPVDQHDDHRDIEHQHRQPVEPPWRADTRSDDGAPRSSHRHRDRSDAARETAIGTAPRAGSDAWRIAARSSSRKPATKLNHGSAIGQEGKATPKVASSCGRKVSGGAKVKAARTILRSQMPILPSRRRSAGNSRRRRGRQNSHKPTASKLPRRTTRVSGASSRLLVRHHAG